jgi:hypothetical protein
VHCLLSGLSRCPISVEFLLATHHQWRLGPSWPLISFVHCTYNKHSHRLIPRINMFSDDDGGERRRQLNINSLRDHSVGVYASGRRRSVCRTCVLRVQFARGERWIDEICQYRSWASSSYIVDKRRSSPGKITVFGCLLRVAIPSCDCLLLGRLWLLLLEISWPLPVSCTVIVVLVECSIAFTNQSISKSSCVTIYVNIYNNSQRRPGSFN